QATRAFATNGAGPRAITVGDVNGDGRPDLVVANQGSTQMPGNVSVLLGTGDGTFQAPQTFDGGMTPVAVSVADLNGDGRPDLAVANYGSIDSPAQPGNAAVLLGNGDGTFQAPQSFVTAGTRPCAVAVQDLNADGISDLAVANCGPYRVAVLVGNGDGTFQPAMAFATGSSNPEHVAVGDFNRDGVLDLAVAGSGLNTVGILLGAGNGTFQAALVFATGSEPRSTAVGDFNRDG